MSGIRNLAGVLAFSSVAALVGCNGITIGGTSVVDRTNFPSREVCEAKADETTVTWGNAFDLVDFYGSIGEIDKMYGVVRKAGDIDVGRGVSCGDHADKYKKFWNGKSRW